MNEIIARPFAYVLVALVFVVATPPQLIGLLALQFISSQKGREWVCWSANMASWSIITSVFWGPALVLLGAGLLDALGFTNWFSQLPAWALWLGLLVYMTLALALVWLLLFWLFNLRFHSDVLLWFAPSRLIAVLTKERELGRSSVGPIGHSRYRPGRVHVLGGSAFRVLVFGSREFHDSTVLWGALDAALSHRLPDVEILTTGETGVSELAASYAWSRGLKVTVIFADHQNRPNDADDRRDEQLVALAEAAVVALDGGGDESATLMMRVRAKGIPLTVIDVHQHPASSGPDADEMPQAGAPN